MPVITATYLNYYHICKHKLWLFANGVTMEHSSELVAQGNVLHKTAYLQRAKKYTEVTLSGSKIDYYHAKSRTIHEVKKSDSMRRVDQWQIKYYIWLFEQNGISEVTGKIEYPYLRETLRVVLRDQDRKYLLAVIKKLKQIISNERPPRRIRKNICARCAYFDFCWVGK